MYSDHHKWKSHLFNPTCLTRNDILLCTFQKYGCFSQAVTDTFLILQNFCSYVQQANHIINLFLYSREKKRYSDFQIVILLGLQYLLFLHCCLFLPSISSSVSSVLWDQMLSLFICVLFSLFSFFLCNSNFLSCSWVIK